MLNTLRACVMISFCSWLAAKEEVCIPSESCPVFLEAKAKLEEILPVKSSTRSAILKSLKERVCNKTEKMVCCKEEDPENTMKCEDDNNTCVCSKSFRDFPNSLDNTKICTKVVSEGKRLDWLSANRALCEESKDLFDTFISNSCGAQWCREASTKFDFWFKQTTSRLCQGVQGKVETKEVKKMCKSYRNKAVDFLQCYQISTEDTQAMLVTTTISTTTRSTTTRVTTTPTAISKVQTTDVESVLLSQAQKKCGLRPPRDITLARPGATWQGGRPVSESGAVSESDEVRAPWAVSLGRWVGGQFQHHCTGSIIAPSIILTAAHCVTDPYFNMETFVVKAGVTNLQETTGQEAQMRKAIFHPKWRSEGERIIYYDIAVIFLSTPLLLGPEVQPICLPTTSHQAIKKGMIGDGITTVGWGRDEKDIFGKELTSIDVTIRSNEECNSHYNGSGNRVEKLAIRSQLPSYIVASQFCADRRL